MSEGSKRGFENNWTYVQDLRHHLEGSFKRGILDRLLRILVKDVGTLEVLDSEHLRSASEQQSGHPRKPTYKQC